MDFTNQRVLVIGMARSGRAALEVLQKRGAVVSAYDAKSREQLGNTYTQCVEQGIKVFAGVDPSGVNLSYDLVVISPGIARGKVPFLASLPEETPVIWELELAFLIKNPAVSTFAITGTNGKTTTVSLLQAILENSGRKSRVGGNIGVPLTTVVDQLQEGSICVEVSSFQLESTRRFRPDYCGILNITPDHLDRHKSMEGYIKTKAKVFANQQEKDILALNFEDPLVRAFAQQTSAQVRFFSAGRDLPGACVRGDWIVVDLPGSTQEICPREEIRLRGTHNLENVLCAVSLAAAAGIEKEAIRKTLATFGGVRHRMEEVTIVEDVLYVNDSKATNPESTMKAIMSFGQPLILIAGGRNKGSSFQQMASLIKERVQELILLGEAREEIKSAVIGAGFRNIHEVKDLPEAVDRASRLARPGEVVLLSPACASWDMFASYEERGDQFCELVRNLSRG